MSPKERGESLGVLPVRFEKNVSSDLEQHPGRNPRMAGGASGEFELLTGLRSFPGSGCSSFDLGGIKVSLVCCKLGKDQRGHLFVVDKAGLKDESPEIRPALHTGNGLCPGMLLAGVLLLAYGAVALFNWIKPVL